MKGFSRKEWCNMRDTLKDASLQQEKAHFDAFSEYAKADRVQASVAELTVSAYADYLRPPKHPWERACINACVTAMHNTDSIIGTCEGSIMYAKQHKSVEGIWRPREYLDPTLAQQLRHAYERDPTKFSLANLHPDHGSCVFCIGRHVARCMLNYNQPHYSHTGDDPDTQKTFANHLLDSSVVDRDAVHNMQIVPFCHKSVGPDAFEMVACIQPSDVAGGNLPGSWLMHRRENFRLEPDRLQHWIIDPRIQCFERAPTYFFGPPSAHQARGGKAESSTRRARK